MQFYSSFSFFCPAGLPQDCPVRRVRICRPFRGKGPSTCSKGKTGACVLTRQRRAEPPESPGRHPARRRFPPKKSRCALGKTPPDLRSALSPSATRSRTKKQDAPPSFSARENVRRGSPPMFFPSPHQICGMADRPARLRRQHQSAADLRAAAPAAVLRQRPAPVLPRKKRTKKRRCRSTVFFCSTRRKTGENIRVRSCRTFRRAPAARNSCCVHGRTCTPCPPAADSLPCRPSPSSF